MSHPIVFRITMTIPLSEIEWCVLCKHATPFRRDDPVEARTDYVEGCGQLCHSCAVRMNVQQHSQERRFLYESET